MLKLDHIAVGVSNLNAAIDFYEQKIGLKILFKKVGEAHGEAFAYLEMKGARLELLQSLRLPKSRAADDHSFCPHMAFASNDIYATEQNLREKKSDHPEGADGDPRHGSLAVCRRPGRQRAGVCAVAKTGEADQSDLS